MASSNNANNDNILLAMLTATTSSPILTPRLLMPPSTLSPTMAALLQAQDNPQLEDLMTTPLLTTTTPWSATDVMVTQYSYQGTMATTLKTPSTSDHILLGICFIVGVLGIVGNAVMVISILGIRSFRQASNIFFFHHGLLEIAKSALIIPYALSITGKKASYCELLGAMQCVLVTTTSLNLAAITINQSFIISHTMPGTGSFDEPERSPVKEEKRRLTSGGSKNKGPTPMSTSSSQAIKIIPALEDGTFNKPSLKRNITCVIFGVLLIWMASLVLNMGVSLITGSGQYNEKIGLCYFVYGHQKSYVVNVMWIVVTSLGVGATIGCLRKLKMDLKRNQEYLLQTFPNSIRTNSHRSTDGSSVRSSKSLPQLRNIQPSATTMSIDQQPLTTQPGGGSRRSNNNKTSMKSSRSIDDRHQQRLTSMISKQAFQQTRLLSCQFNVIVLQTISFIVFWYPLFGLIIADKEFMVDTEIYKALTVLAWLNAPLTPVFFTYFNYECYSTQVAVRLSVVGNAAAQVVREQALIAEKLAKTSDEENGGGISATEAERQPLKTATINANKLRQQLAVPKPPVSQRGVVPINFNTINHTKYYPDMSHDHHQHHQQQQQQQFSTFRPPLVPPYMGRSVHDLPQQQNRGQEGVYWFERGDRRDFSSNSLHQICQQPIDQQSQMTRTETFPKLQFDDGTINPDNLQHSFWTKPGATSRSLREIRDFRSSGSGKPGQSVRFPVLPPPVSTRPASHHQQTAVLSPSLGANRPHSYENISGYNFDETRRSKTTMDNRQPDESEESEDEPKPPSPRRRSEKSWARQKQQLKEDHQKLCSWRQIATKHQPQTAEILRQTEPPEPPRQQQVVVPKKKSSMVRKNSGRSSSRQHSKQQTDSDQTSSEDEDYNPPKLVQPTSPKMVPKPLQEVAPAIRKSLLPHGVSSSVTVTTSSTDQDVPKCLQGFKNPLYIEAFRRANMRQRTAITSDEDQGIPMIDMAPSSASLTRHRSSETPQLRFVANQAPWNRSINETEDDVVESSLPSVQIGRIDSLNTTLNNLEDEDDVEIHIEPVMPKEAENEPTTTKEPSLPQQQQQRPAQPIEAAGYTRIESHVQTAAGSSVDRLQIWLGKLDNQQPPSSSVTSPQTRQPPNNDAPPPKPPGSVKSVRVTTTSLIDEFHFRHQQHHPRQTPIDLTITSSSGGGGGNTQTTSSGSPKGSPKMTTNMRKMAANLTAPSNSGGEKSGGSGSEHREVWI